VRGHSECWRARIVVVYERGIARQPKQEQSTSIECQYESPCRQVGNILKECQASLTNDIWQRNLWCALIDGFVGWSHRILQFGKDTTGLWRMNKLQRSYIATNIQSQSLLLQKICPNQEWKRLPGRLRATWLRTVEKHLALLNRGLHTACRSAKNCITCSRIVNAATLRQDARHWWFGGMSNKSDSSRALHLHVETDTSYILRVSRNILFFCMASSISFYSLMHNE